MSSPADDPVGERAWQPDIVTRADLLADGYDAVGIAAMKRAGLLRPVRRGVYARHPSATTPMPPEPDRTLRDRAARTAIAAAARRSPHLVLSHSSAALLHGIPLVGVDARVVHFTRIARTGANRAEGRIVHSRVLPAGDIIEIDGLLMTTPARTLVDLGCWTRGGAVVAAGDWALHTGLVVPDEVSRAVEQARGQHGIGRARRLLRLVDGRSESVGESLTRWGLVESGLPAPELQVSIHSPEGLFLGRPDLAYLADAALIEFDGRVKYGALLKPGQDASAVVVAEKLREDRLREHGYVVLRVVWSDLRHRRDLVARVEAARAAGRRLVAAGVVRGVPNLSPALRLAV